MMLVNVLILWDIGCGLSLFNMSAWTLASTKQIVWMSLLSILQYTFAPGCILNVISLTLEIINECNARTKLIPKRWKWELLSASTTMSLEGAITAGIKPEMDLGLAIHRCQTLWHVICWVCKEGRYGLLYRWGRGYLPRCQRHHHVW